MATPLTDGINALTRYANETTGKQDTTLSDAVGSLVEGYGGGDTSKTAIINADTEYIHITGHENSITDRFFDRLNAKVVYMDGYTAINSSYYFEFMPNLQALILPDVTKVTSYILWDTNLQHAKPTVDMYQIQGFLSATPFRVEQGGNCILRNSVMSTTKFTASVWGMSPDFKFYVPQNLLNDYLADANWGTFGANRILPIEGSIYENIDWWKSLIE